MSQEGQMTVYYIPDNFVGESRILGGRINVRYLIDAVVLSAICFMLIGYPLVFIAMRNAETPYRAATAIITMAPGMMLGMVGFNGDPFSVFLKNLISWSKQKEVRLYNETPRRLGTDPVRIAYENRQQMDKFVEFVENYQQKRIDDRLNMNLVEGETFEFQYDPGIDSYLEEAGDYNDDTVANGAYWPEADIEIEAGDDLGGLESLLNSDWYMELADAASAEDDAVASGGGDA